MSDCRFSKTLLVRYADESKADWDYVLQNRDIDPKGSESRLFRIAELALKGTDLIHMGSGDFLSATASGA